MKFLPKVIAAGLLGLASLGSPAHALTAGLLGQAGPNVRIQVSHKGEPVEVEIIGIDKNYNRVEVEAWPAQFLATGSIRKVTVKSGPEVWAVCARTVEPWVGPQGQLFYSKSCSAVKPSVRQSVDAIRPTRTGTRLRDALTR